MSDTDAPGGDPAIRSGRTEHSPEPGPADSLRLALAPGDLVGLPPLMLHGVARLGAGTEGRYSGRTPAAVLAVAVARETGRVHLAPLIAEDDLPAIYRGDDAPPAFGRMTPAGLVAEGYSTTWFSVDLKRQLGLPDAPGTYDVFLWLDTIISDLASAEKPDDFASGPGSAPFERPASIALVTPAPASDALELSFALRDGDRLIRGRCGAGRVSVIAHAVQSRSDSWTVLQAPPGGGLDFEMEAEALLPEARPTDRILVVAVAEGRRSALLTVPPAA